jgi:hypothetical protein
MTDEKQSSCISLAVSLKTVTEKTGYDVGNVSDGGLPSVMVWEMFVLELSA